MSFSAEMRDFLTAYKTGQSINASRTDQDYKEAKTEAEKLKTERDNDPETLALAKKQAQATLASTQARMSDAAARTGIASRTADASIDAAKALAEQRRMQAKVYEAAMAGGGGGSGLLPTQGGAVAQPGVLPVSPPTIETDEDAYAEGGRVPRASEDYFSAVPADEDGNDVSVAREMQSQRGALDTEERASGRRFHDSGMRIPGRQKGRNDDYGARIGKPVRYAAGGLVPDDEEAEAVPDDEAAEGEGVLPTSSATDFSAQSRRTQPAGPQMGINGIVSPQLVDDARKAGLMWGVQKAGLGQGAIRTPAAMLKAKQIAQGMGGMSEEEMQAAKQAVDPEGKLTDSQRNIAALGSVYQFWANKGEPDKAGRVAFQMLQYYRNASQRYAAIAAKAAEGGNMDLATKAALKAYANVPDSKDLEIVPNPDGGLMYTYTDANGDVINKGIATPQQLVASAMGLATGGFDKALMSAAGAAPAQGAVPTGGGKTQSASDRATESQSIGGEIEKMKMDWVKKNPNQPANDEEWSEVGNVAQHIYQQNPKATANEVARAAYAMLVPTGDPEKAPFKVKPGEEGKPSTVDFGGKLKVQLDDEQLESILNSRAARVKTAVDKINADMEESDKPGFVDKAVEAGKTIASGVSKLPTIPEAAVGGVKTAYGLLSKAFPTVPVDMLKEVVPTELVERVGSDLSKINSLVSGKLNNPAKNPGAIPVEETDRPL